jgi:hypothetical protein
VSAVEDKVQRKQIYDRVEREGLGFYVEDDEGVVRVTKYSGTIGISNAKLK